MQITMPALSTNSLWRRINWQRLAIVTVFILTTLVTVLVAEFAISVVFPTRQIETAADRAILQELLAEPTISLDADLESQGFVLDNSPAGQASLVLAASPTVPLAAATPLTTTVTVAGSTVTPVPSATATTAATATATNSPTSALPNWDRKGRVNILLMGLDGNANQGRFRRADSLIVASIDPATNSAALIGIPRDLYVTIYSPKGAIRNKINTAYVWGELYNYPGGGPALQMRTVGETLGLPIHHYVAVYFDGFAKLIDAIGGIDIDVPQAIRDNFTGWSFNPGMQHMDGKRALQYARSRYSTSDFSRGRRQQVVILAAVDKITKAGILPKLPAVLPAVTQAFRSDMSIPDLLALASLGYRIDRSSIKTAQIDETMCASYRTPEGASALMPRWDRVKAMVQAALTPPAPAPAPAAASTPAAAIAPGTASAPATTNLVMDGYRSEQARIEILNGTNTVGLARRTQEFLQRQGLTVVSIGDARGIYKSTVLQHDGSKPATRDALVKLLNIRPENIQSLPPGSVNVRIILGTDWKVP